MGVRISQKRSRNRTMPTTVRYQVHVYGFGSKQTYIGQYATLELAEKAKKKFLDENPMYADRKKFEPAFEITPGELLRKAWRKGAINEQQ